ncbi:MAG TPA: thioredoxin domain-containing protein [Actinomycetota bacterium]|nr:thioredoxin domain-containing protein [Actinomycetota bacterium]
MANRLAEETSPYLLQHADNPVDWYPWGDEALERARIEDKPILLSIGYAACHWCHVMERESFEDEATAGLMNEHFVSIKVDREERPDLDAIYMDAVQAMTGHGGWPLTAFLTPDGKPFYAGTYFPDEDRHGMPAFRKVLTAIAQTWRDRRGELEEQSSRIVGAISRTSELAGSDETLSDEVLQQAASSLARAFDRTWGGFGGAPKFPQPMTLEFLLRRHLRGAPDALDMVTITLDRMAYGGMNDQVGGGFHRYSTDARWHVPHFEKMLYDNALLVRSYVHAFQVTGNERYRRVVAETCDYLLREMRHPDGGFFSSQDADSEGVEGRFFVWSWDELVEIGSEAVATAFGATPSGNWEGANVLWRPVPLAAIADEMEIEEPQLAADLDRARAELFARREGRVRPGTDDKVLAAWNGMAIAALAEAGRVLREPRYVEAAVAAADFVLTSLRREDGRLLRSWRDGRAGRPGYADDHALMADACLVLFETTFEVRWFEQARTLADELIRLFHDTDRGGFFQTGSDAESLVIRPKELYDNAVPSGNSVAADVLQRLAHLTGEAEYERVGVSALRLVRDALPQAPTGFGHALCALDLYLDTVKEVAIVGDPASSETRALLDEVLVRRFLPNHVLAVAPSPDSAAASTVTLLEGRPQLDGKPTAYVCERFACQLPVSTPEDLEAQLTA